MGADCWPIRCWTHCRKHPGALVFRRQLKILKKMGTFSPTSKPGTEMNKQHVDRCMPSSLPSFCWVIVTQGIRRQNCSVLSAVSPESCLGSERHKSATERGSSEAHQACLLHFTSLVFSPSGPVSALLQSATESGAGSRSTVQGGTPTL